MKQMAKTDLLHPARQIRQAPDDAVVVANEPGLNGLGEEEGDHLLGSVLMEP